MRRLICALKEWLELRARMKEERQFHLDRAAADLRGLGLTPREAERMARIRFGNRRHSQAGLRELGGDLRGLIHLFHAHRVVTSIWLMPAVLFAAVAILFAVRPSPREMMEGLLGQTLDSADHSTVSLEVYGAGPASPGITETEFEEIQSMKIVAHAARFGPHEIRAHVATGLTLRTITSDAISATGNSGFYAAWVTPQPRVMTAPAKVIWLLIALYALFFSCTHAGRLFTARSFLYGVFLGFLHALASILVWALAIQLWLRTSWQTSLSAGLSFSVLAIAYVLGTAIQCGCLWWDFRHRCPACLDRLLLSWTQGDEDRILLNPAAAESVCAHGHGVLLESRWVRDFRHSSVFN